VRGIEFAKFKMPQIKRQFNVFPICLSDPEGNDAAKIRKNDTENKNFLVFLFFGQKKAFQLIRVVGYSHTIPSPALH